MRLWSLHPRYLDRAGLTAAWREALLAQAVLAGRTRGYTKHPQLERFRACEEPHHAVGRYLEGIAAEADRRGYRFDRSRILAPGHDVPAIPVTTGQLALERDHLLAKLTARSPDARQPLLDDVAPRPHPSFFVVPGPVADWERAVSPRAPSRSSPPGTR